MSRESERDELARLAEQLLACITMTSVFRPPYKHVPLSLCNDIRDALLFSGFGRREDGWRPISEAPVGADVLLYCPQRCASNLERIELGQADNGHGSQHSWATHWRPLPPPPTAEGGDRVTERGPSPIQPSPERPA